MSLTNGVIIEEAAWRAADSAASGARDSAAEARSEYYTAEEMAEFAKPKKKKVRSGARWWGWSLLLGLYSPADICWSYRRAATWAALRALQGNLH